MTEQIKIRRLKPIYPATERRDMRDLVNKIGTDYSDECAFIIKEKTGPKGKSVVYRRITFAEFRDDVLALAAGFVRMGMTEKKIAVIGINQYEWMVTYFAVLSGIGIIVPLDKGLPYRELLVSVEKSEPDVMVYDKGHAGMIEKLMQEDTSIRAYCLMDAKVKAGTVSEDPQGNKPAVSGQENAAENYDGEEGPLTIAAIIESGRKALAEDPEIVSRLPIDPDELALLVFTSGTSNMAKAVMLTQHNVLNVVYGLQRVEGLTRGDVNMAFLPFHHTFGSTGEVLVLAEGATTVFCDGLKYIQKNIVEYKVSYFICVPLLIEAIYKKIMQAVEKQGKMKTFKRGIKISRFLMKFGIDVRRKLFKEILDQLGGALRFVISGASPLDPTVAQGFEDLGIKVCQGYGLTEAAPVVIAENPENRKPGSIGLAMPDVEAVIDDPNEEGIGELIARGPNIMLGYYKEPEATAAAIQNGWFRTGDLARVDKDGYVFITGRAKNVIVLKNGKNVYPEELEVLIAALPYVKENIVIGEPKHDDPQDLALKARIVYDRGYMESNHGTSDPAEIEKIVKADIDRINETLPNYKRMLRVSVQETEMAKTTTGKVKRFEEGAIRK